ncbi:S1C family serine protease [uncultured Adlercreutzia sp.]|uniref:S1C family serine protease n=1 Tax=uncultured Adlercreutzia sp. TaxID=875803 RepID=UPI0025FF1252|nr:trypsin-like peptidase domain-containing protein [uncultured Adlercreutzia sp.]
MTDMNGGIPTPPGQNPGQHPTPGDTQPTPLQPTQPAAPAQPQGAYQPYASAQQPYGSQQNYGQAGTYGQQPYGAGAPHQTYEAEPVAVHAQHAAPKGSGGKTFLIAFAGALVACVLAFGVWGVFNAMNPVASHTETITNPTTGEQTTINVSAEDSTLSEAVAAKCLPSVVAIDVYATPQQSTGGMGGLEELFGYGYDYGYGYGDDQGSQDKQGGQDLQMYSQGSGVVLTQDGYIITNNHVVEGGEAYKVTVAGETYDAELVGTDPSSDVAVLKAKDVSGLTVMELGDSDNLTIGEWVMTLGSPFGLEQSVATGIVSATSRSQIMDAQESLQSGGTGEVTIYPNMIQTDAAINPGNSGGALVDSEGKLIGINTLITSYSGNYSGVGFAIPVNYAVNLANQIIAGETPTHAQLGVSLSTVDAQNAQRYGLSTDTGAYVAAVSKDSGAAAAGIQVGDIITAFDGQPVESASDLMLDVRTKQPGDTVTLTVNRGGQTSDIQVTLGDDSATQQEKAKAQSQQQSYDGYRLEDLFGQRDAEQQDAA